MNDEEMEKKIAQIIAEYCCPLGKTHKQLYCDDRQCYSKMNFAECKPITECTDALIAAGIGDVSEYKHRAEVAEKETIKYGRALYNLAVRYVSSAKICTIKADDGKTYLADKEICALYIIKDEIKQAEKELAEERKDD